ncbi:MAG: hypothetical protein GVY17_15310 [Cyanobacteria bacterium]|jgi:hypothetical protein|nr:hypothetical protein [Cyanobacteria bacterium GSL.Bin21]
MKLEGFWYWFRYFLTARRFLMIWFGFSLTLTLTYSLLGLQEAFAGDYVVQDDARQHVFWMQRFLNPNLFPNDLIANYFQSVAPWGYRFVYWLPAQLGIDPLIWNKLIPVSLNLITASFCFGICFNLLPIPAAAFSSTLLLAQSLGFTAAVVSGTQKAFIYPLFLGFIYFLLKKRLWATLIIIALQGLFYPQILLITIVILLIRLFELKRGKFQWTSQKTDRWLSGFGLLVALLVMLPFALNSHEFAPVITPEKAQELPEFLAGGRSRFFYPDEPSKFWLKGRSGLRLASALTPVTNSLGILLPFLILFPRTFPLTKQLSKKIILFPQLLIASGILFTAAHLLLFRLHLPSRYMEHSLRILFTITAGLVIVILIDAAIQARQTIRSRLLRLGLPLTTLIILGTPLLFYPLLLPGFPTTAYRQGTAPELYQFLREQPVDTLVVSLAAEANNLPTFAQRSILIGAEYAIPYHWGYYQQFRQRTLDLITAQYSANPNIVINFINQYQVNFWLLDQSAFHPDYLANNDWLQQYQPASAKAQLQLKQGTTPVLQTLMAECRRFENEQLLLLASDCIISQVTNDK